jgi:glycosyltransferase involved in cell wall biosynthesis
MDFNMRGGAPISTMTYVNTCIASGKRVGLFQWRRYDLDTERAIDSSIWSLAAQGKVDLISAGDLVRANTIIVGYPTIIQYPIDNPPKIEHDNLVVIVSQMAYRLHGRGDQQYSPENIVAVLIETFGDAGTWVPVSGLVRRLMIEHGGYPPPHTENWLPIMDVRTREPTPLEWRADVRRQPVVGRHGRDHYIKWPSTRQALLDAYCAERNCIVHILGGAEKALDVIGTLPANWLVSEFGSIDVGEFLRNIDFFIHYPHEDCIEAFGLAVAEAMAAGKPVILPPVFEETFGNAAMYALPEDVWSVISELWSDREAYLARARIGRHFVETNCAPERFDRLVANLRRSSL